MVLTTSVCLSCLTCAEDRQALEDDSYVSFRGGWVKLLLLLLLLQYNVISFVFFFQIIYLLVVHVATDEVSAFFSIPVRSIRTNLFSDGKSSSITSLFSLESILTVPEPISLCILCFLRYGHFCPFDTRCQSILRFALILLHS